METQFCCNPYFEDINVFHHDQPIREQCEPNTNFCFVQEKQQVNTENSTQLNGAAQEYTKHTHTHQAFTSSCSSPRALPLWATPKPIWRSTCRSNFKWLSFRHFTITHKRQSFQNPLLQVNFVFFNIVFTYSLTNEHGENTTTVLLGSYLFFELCHWGSFWVLFS